jgi:hypothetical protein
LVIITTRTGDVVIMVITDYEVSYFIGDKDFVEFFYACLSTNQKLQSDHPKSLEIGNELIMK